jgi:hypothetical protein
MIAFMALILMSCAPTKVMMCGERFPPRAEDAPPDVYRTKAPDREYIEIAEISCGDTSDKYSMNQVQVKARELGADWIIILGKAITSHAGAPTENMFYIPLRLRRPCHCHKIHLK